MHVACVACVACVVCVLTCVVELKPTLRKDRVHHEAELSNKPHEAQHAHQQSMQFDHEAFLGKEEAKTFDQLSPEESRDRLRWAGQAPAHTNPRKAFSPPCIYTINPFFFHLLYAWTCPSPGAVTRSGQANTILLDMRRKNKVYRVKGLVWILRYLCILNFNWKIL